MAFNALTGTDFTTFVIMFKFFHRIRWKAFGLGDWF